MIKTKSSLLTKFNLPKENMVWYAILKMLSCGLIILQPFLLSISLSRITEGNYMLSRLFILLSLLIGILYFLFSYFNFLNKTKIETKLKQQINSNIINQVIADVSLSKEKANQLFVVDVPNVANFYCCFVDAISQILKVVILLIILFINNYVIALIVFGCLIINWVFEVIMSTKKLKLNNLLYNATVLSNEKFNELINKNQLIKNFNVQKVSQLKQIDYMNAINDIEEKIDTNKFISEKWIFLFWQIVSSAILLYLIYKFNNLLISFSSFIILFEYLKPLNNYVTNVFSFKQILLKFGSSSKRLENFLINNNILNDEKDNINSSLVADLDILYFDENDKSYNINVKSNEILKICNSDKLNSFEELFVNKNFGQKNKLLINKIDSSILSATEFNAIFEYVNSCQDCYFSGTLKYNLELVNKLNINEEKYIKLFKLNKLVKKLPNGIESDISNCILVFNQYDNLKINLLRAYLSSAKVICIKLDFSLNEHKTEFNQILQKIKKGIILVVLDSGNNFIICDKNVE